MRWCSLENEKVLAHWGGFCAIRAGGGNKEGRLVIIQFVFNREQTLSTMKTILLMMLRKTVTGDWIYSKITLCE